MKTSILIGASGAYLCIKEAHRTMDILLPAGHSKENGAAQVLQEMKDDLARRQSRIDLLTRAIEEMQS